MTTNKKRKVTTINRALMSIFIVLCFFLSLNQSQEAYAEMKKVSGTYEQIAKLIDGRTIHGQTTVLIANYRFMYSSSDPDWDKATTFDLRYYVNPTFQEDKYGGYAATTHPNGDQTFTEFNGTWKWVLPRDGFKWTTLYEGIFTGGTGKFKGIKGTITIKGKGETQMIHTGEWEVLYEIIN